MRGIAAKLASAVLAALPVYAAEPGIRDPDFGVLNTPLMDMVAQGITSVSVVPAGGDDYDFVWIAWGDEAATPRIVHLALLRRGAGAARRTWSLRHDGYSPTLTPMDGWNFGTRGIVLLQYQSGAASAHADIYGIDTKSVPAVLGSLDGALIKDAQVDGASVIEVYQGADLREAPACYGWNSDRRELKQVSCRAASR